jgi:hypothetical protein
VGDFLPVRLAALIVSERRLFFDKKTMLCLLTLRFKNPSVQPMTKSASPTGSKNQEKGPVRGPFFYSIFQIFAARSSGTLAK